MPQTEVIAADLYGMYRDIVRDAYGHVTWDSGWQKNTIVTSCRILLASFMHGDTIAQTPTFGIGGLLVGMGSDDWDRNPPQPDPGVTHLKDSNPFTVDLSHIKIDYLDGPNVTSNQTNRLQIAATLGPGIPNWPDLNHPTAMLREFGLFGRLVGSTAPVLINYVFHTAIAKDPLSTLDRTIWLTF